jgi:uncharacterized protein (UPF0264 family)
VIAVGFADAPGGVASLRALIDLAAAAGARGVLLDTIDKNGPGLRALVSAQALAAWVRHAHDAGLLAAVAGKIRPGDIAFVRDAGADIVGVRGAACDGGRTGRVAPEKVRLLRQLVRDEAGATGPGQRRPARLRRTPACRPTS